VLASCEAVLLIKATVVFSMFLKAPHGGPQWLLPWFQGLGSAQCVPWFNDWISRYWASLYC